MHFRVMMRYNSSMVKDNHYRGGAPTRQFVEGDKKLSHYRIDPKQAYKEYVEEGKTLTVIAKEHGANIKSVSRSIERYRQQFLSNIPKLDYFKKNRPDILADKMMLMVQEITAEKLSKTGIKDIAVAISKLYPIERLERGKSTQNVDVLLSSIDALTEHRLTRKENSANGNRSKDHVSTDILRADAKAYIDLDSNIREYEDLTSQRDKDYDVFEF